jgi:hypothetical protein
LARGGDLTPAIALVRRPFVEWGFALMGLALLLTAIPALVPSNG